MCKRQQSGQRENGATKLRQNLSSQPRLWIDGLTLATNFEIKRGSALTAATAHKGDRLSGAHLRAYADQRALVIAVKAHIAFTVLHDHHQAIALQPVRQNHPAVGDGFDLSAFRRADHHPLPT